jgi:hypothetical protein
MVGVAISLLLLPPAVNAGMCWAYVASLNAQSKYWTQWRGWYRLCHSWGHIACSYHDQYPLHLSIRSLYILVERSDTGVQQERVPLVSWYQELSQTRRWRATNCEYGSDNEGIEAALELQRDAGKDIYEKDFEIDLNKRKIAALLVAKVLLRMLWKMHCL